MKELNTIKLIQGLTIEEWIDILENLADIKDED